MSRLCGIEWKDDLQRICQEVVTANIRTRYLCVCVWGGGGGGLVKLKRPVLEQAETGDLPIARQDYRQLDNELW